MEECPYIHDLYAYVHIYVALIWSVYIHNFGEESVDDRIFIPMEYDRLIQLNYIKEKEKRV